MQTTIMNETLNSCRPWANDNLRDNLNILNNFKLNLYSYQKVYKKYSVKAKGELPQIKAHPALKTKQLNITTKKLVFKDKNKTKTLQSNSLIPISKQETGNKSVELHPSRSESKIFKSKEQHKRGQTSMQVIDKQNKQSSLKQKQIKEIVTERGHYNPSIMNTLSKGDLPSKVCLLNFDQQYKYRRMRKRELHQIIFGQRQKVKKRRIAELR